MVKSQLLPYKNQILVIPLSTTIRFFHPKQRQPKSSDLEERVYKQVIYIAITFNLTILGIFSHSILLDQPIIN